MSGVPARQREYQTNLEKPDRRRWNDLSLGKAIAYVSVVRARESIYQVFDGREKLTIAQGNRVPPFVREIVRVLCKCVVSNFRSKRVDGNRHDAKRGCAGCLTFGGSLCSEMVCTPCPQIIEAGCLTACTGAVWVNRAATGDIGRPS